MNEVEPWTSRVRSVVGTRGTRAGRGLGRAWAWFTDLGQGAWLLALSVAVVAAITLAVIHGRNDPGGTPCSQADPYVAHMESLGSKPHHLLDQSDMAWLHDASAKLTTISGSAFGDDVAAIKLAARTAELARAGRPMTTGKLIGKFDGACV